ncbi:MAG TPA: hypothetical protein VGH67_07120 [Solirubrobacteraceae bacterium]|jgi:hypothetical protein
MIEQLESELRSALRARAGELPDGAVRRVRSRDYRPRTRDLRPPVAAGVVVTAAAAAAAILLVDLGPSTSEAFAGWTPSPTRAPAAQVTGAKGDCASRLDDFSTRSAKAMKAAGIKNLPTIREMTPVLIDTRGPFTFVIYSGANGANGTCISGPEFTSLSTRSAGGAPAPPAGKVVAFFQAHTAHGADAYSFVEGHAGAGVTAATLLLSDGSKVQATVRDGWLLAWWPGSAQLVSAQVTTAGGTSTQPFDARATAPCPPPPAGSTTPADTMCAGGFGGQGQGQVTGSSAIQSAGSRPGPASGAASSAGSGN